MASAIRQYLPSEAIIGPELEKILVTPRLGPTAHMETYARALHRLAVLGRAYRCRGGYWRTLMVAAEMLGMPEAQRRFRAYQRRALLRLARSSGQASSV